MCSGGKAVAVFPGVLLSEVIGFRVEYGGVDMGTVLVLLVFVEVALEVFVVPFVVDVLVGCAFLSIPTCGAC